MEVHLKTTSPVFRNLILLKYSSALYPTKVTLCLFQRAGIQLSFLADNLILKIQLSLTIVNLGRFSIFPMRSIVLESSLKIKFIQFSLLIRCSASLIRYSSKQTVYPSISFIGLLLIIISSPKLYLTCTLYEAPSSQTSLLSTKLSSNKSTQRYYQVPNSTASYGVPKVLERATMKSEGNLSPIQTLLLFCLAGKFLTLAEIL